MGWCHDLDKRTEHEGFIVGYVPEGEGAVRELSYPDDDTEKAPTRIAAGCDCGWRSNSWEPSRGVEWYPFRVEAAERDEESAFRLWEEHILKTLPPGENLELREDEGGPRYYLEGEPVHAGESLELRLRTVDGWTWAPVRFETANRKPRAILDLGETLADADFVLPVGAVLRWPDKGRKDRNT